MISKRLVFSGLSVLVALSVSFGQVMAQDSSNESGVETQVIPVEESEASASAVFTKPLLADEIAQVEQSYKGQLEVYRTAANRYQISKQQYIQLQTLTSLETAVSTSREAMVARNEVLLSYLTLLRLNLIQATGVNLTQKEPTLEELELTHEWLSSHQEQAKAASDRYALLEVADEFSLQQPEITAVAYKTLSLLAVGKLQTVYDKTVLLSNQVESEVVATKADVKQDERRRALVEIKRELDQTQAQFSALNEELENPRTAFSRSFYTSLQRNLGSTFSLLSQALSHISELIRL